MTKPTLIWYIFTVGNCTTTPPPAQDNAKLSTIDNTDPAVVYVEYECNKGYVPVSDPVIVCTRGVYNNTGLTCAKRCEVTAGLLPGELCHISPNMLGLSQYCPFVS